MFSKPLPRFVIAKRLASGYPTAALAEFTVAVHWQHLGEGTGRLVRFICPRDLPENG